LVSTALLSAAIVLAVWTMVAHVELLNLPTGMLALSWFLIPAGVAALLFQQLLLALNRIAAFNVLEIVGRLIVVGASFVFLVAVVRDPSSFLVASVLSFGVVALLAGGLLTRQPAIRVVRQVALLREQIGFGLRVYVAGLLSFLVLRSDLLLVQGLRGPIDTGLYATAVTLADAVYIVPVTLGMILFPRLASEPSDAARRALAMRAMRVVGLFSVAIVVPAGVLGAAATTLLFGAAFGPAATPLLLLLPGLIALSMSTLLMNYFAASGMPGVTLIPSAAGLLVNVVLNVALLPTSGIAGSALASTVAYTVMFGLAIRIYQDRGKQSE
jgi:O-antigen/teichoic acid export membrane protein